MNKRQKEVSNGRRNTKHKGIVKVHVNLPKDMTQVNKIIAEFQAMKIIKECTHAQVNAIIEYLEDEEKQSKEKKNE